MKFLITGNLGYVGPVVQQHLRRRFPEAILAGFDAGFFAHCLTGVDRTPDVVLDEQLYGDVRSFPVERLAGIDGIVHLAAISNDPIGKEFEAVTMDVNCAATLRIAAAARRAGVRSFVFASSCSVYGLSEGAPRTEQSSLNPLTAYARSKIATEAALAEMADERFVVTCLRFATACGMSDRLRLDLVLNDFTAAALASGRITILSDGTPWRPLVHVQDMALAVEWALARDAGHGGAFLTVNAGSDEWNHQVRDLAYAVKAVIPEAEVTINPSAPPDPRSYRVDFGLFRRLAPDHQPRMTLPAAIDDLREGIDRMGFGLRDFRNSNYIRLNVLKSLVAAGLLTSGLEWTGAARRA